MKMNVKGLGLTITVLLVSLAGLAKAGTYAPVIPQCVSHDVTAPCEHGGWDAAIEWIYVEPNNNDLWYVTRVPPIVGNVSEATPFFADTDYDDGFRIEGSFHFNAGNDLTINWLRFHEDHTTALSSSSLEMRLPRLASSENNDTAAAFVRYEADIVNIELAQHIDVGTDTDLRLHFGLQYFTLDHDFNSTLLNSVSNENTSRVQHSEFDGAGPRIGADVAYSMNDSFAVVGRLAAAVLVGDLKSKGQTTASLDTLVNPPAPTVNVVPEREERVLVPTGMGKAGFSYQNEMYGGVAILEGGWQWHEYLDVIRHVFVSRASGVHQATSNFGMHGPYLMLKFIS